MEEFREVDVRVMPSGAARITLKGEDRDVARRVATTFRKALGEGARVSCPCPMAEIEVAGFDPSLSAAELNSALIKEGQCSSKDVQVGRMSRTRGGAGRIWARLPAVVARSFCREGLRIGWTRGRAYPIGPRLVQCLRCLGFGHISRRCAASVAVIVPGGCYNCTGTNHRAAGCKAPPSCAACSLRGWATDHRMGSGRCATLAAYAARGDDPNNVDQRHLRGPGVAAGGCPPGVREGLDGGGSASIPGRGGSLDPPPPKSTAMIPPVGGPLSGLPPEGLDPGEGSAMEVEEL